MSNSIYGLTLYPWPITNLSFSKSFSTLSDFLNSKLAPKTNPPLNLIPFSNLK